MPIIAKSSLGSPGRAPNPIPDQLAQNFAPFHPGAIPWNNFAVLPYAP